MYVCSETNMTAVTVIQLDLEFHVKQCLAVQYSLDYPDLDYPDGKRAHNKVQSSITTNVSNRSEAPPTDRKNLSAYFLWYYFYTGSLGKLSSTRNAVSSIRKAYYRLEA